MALRTSTPCLSWSTSVGSGHTTIDGIQYDYSSGDFIVIEPGTVHDEYRREETEVMYFGFFNYHDCIRLSNGIYQDGNGVILRLLHKMEYEVTNKQNHFTLKLNLLLQCSLIEISRMCEKEMVQDSEETLLRTITYMQQYYSSNISLTQLANMSSYSYDHFRHLFKEYVGMTPMSYINHLRIEKAKKMLLEKTATIMEISLECGFSNSSRFSETFKKKTGKSPRQYMLEAEVNKQMGKIGGIYSVDHLLYFVEKK
jgi:AraC family transcriptional activator of pobA